MKFELFSEIKKLSQTAAFADEWKIRQIIELDEYGDDNCICGHKIKFQYHIVNRYNGNRTIVGSCCVTKLGMKPGLRSKRQYLEYAYLKADSDWEKLFALSLMEKANEWGSRTKVSDRQKAILERITGRVWHWPIWVNR